MSSTLLVSSKGSLEKRWIYGFYGDDGNSGWSSWGRWVLLGFIVGVAILFFLILQITSSRRVRRGEPAIPYTGWMVPPSYHQSQQQQYEDYSLPTYKAQPGEGDAGYYRNGEFVPNENNGNPHSETRPVTQPAAQQDSPPATEPIAQAATRYLRHSPPAGPPPSQSGNNFHPPPGPPRDSQNSGNIPDAPPAARFKN